MIRRLILAFVSFILLANSAWPKFKDDEQKYLDDQFRHLLEQVQGLSKQVQTLETRLAEARQVQAQLQEMLAQQQRSLQELQKQVAAMRSSNDENYSNVNALLAKMHAETERSLTALAGKGTEGPLRGREGIATPAATSSTQRLTQAYVINVEGNEVVIDQGSDKGIRVGRRLGFYKAGDPNTRAGEVEVTVIVGPSSSRARILTMAKGVQPEFGDIVRPQ